EISVDFADLAIIDLAKFGTPEGKAELVKDICNAMNTTGFFYVINHGYSQEQTRRMFDIAELPFTISEEEKQKYVAKIQESGSFQGYKPRQFWHVDAGVRDQIEHYNFHTDVTLKEHPEALRPFLPEIDGFMRHNYFNILLPLFRKCPRLLALGLELPEETFVEKSTLAHISIVTLKTIRPNDTSYPRSSEDEEKTKNVWLKGHTDNGALTLLWSQPVSALQIRTTDGEWKWVKHIDNALVVNAGDTLEFLSGGFYKATIHRVHQPPPDQRNLTRLGVFYFSLFDDDVKLLPLVQSPVLQRVGITRRMDDELAPTAGVYRKARISSYGLTSPKEGKDKGVEEEEIAGVVIRHYN
ncbi:UPF0676 protein, partial [Termitomyces sp. J132]